MTRRDLFERIKAKQTFLCVGLDTDVEKIPKHLLGEKDPVFGFNRRIIEATASACVAYKFNLAFYEAQGAAGWESLEKSIALVRKTHFTIADAKRGDIGNTSNLYARAYFETLGCDAVTVAPYMGEDSVRPFLEHTGKWAIVLAHTSNPGAADFQLLETASGRRIYEEVLIRSKAWGTAGNMMYVAGATQPEALRRIREIVPDHFLLVPGVGAQGGSLEKIAEYGMNSECGLLVNSSRDILYAGSGTDFATRAGEAAMALRDEMAVLL